MSNVTYLPRFTVLSISDRFRYIEVKVRIAKSVWDKMDKGTLYGIDISNEVYKTHKDIMSCPSVDDKSRARNGFKYVTITFAKRSEYAK
jgi:hypothetical protein